jgi:hypothetical protein
MSKPILSALLVGVVTAAGMLGWSNAGNAADLPVPAQRGASLGCGPCGCLRASFLYHRELKSTYGIAFDPRSYDQTEPRYYYGRVRAYPRYWVCADPIQ